MSRICVAIVFLFSTESIYAQQIERALKGVYIGWWANTRWAYTFTSEQKFQFDTQGHFGNTHTIGIYKLVGDTIIISASAKDLQPDSTFLPIVDTLLLDGDSCIIHFSVGYDYCKQKENQQETYHSRKRRKSVDEFKKPE